MLRIDIIEKARVAEAEDRLLDALRSYRDALTQDPMSPVALLGVARLSYTFGDVQEALESYSTALTRDPQCAEGYRGRSWCFLAIGSAELALQDAHRAVALEPMELEFWFSRGLLQLELGLIDDAEADLRHVLEQTPDDADAALELARCLIEQAHLGEGVEPEGVAEILDLLDVAAQTLGEDGMIRLLESEVALFSGDIPGAAERLHVALTLDPELVHEVAERPHLHIALRHLRA